MVPATTSLTGFSGETTWPLGQLRLLVTIGDITYSTKVWMNFMIVNSLSPYNGIIRRPGLKAIQAVRSTVHEMLKFPTKEGIVTICSSLLIPAECTSIDTSSPLPKEKETRPTNLTVPLHPNFPDQKVVVGGSLSDKGRTELCALLKKNLDIFAWQPSDITGVPRSIAEQRLNKREGCPPVRQKKRGQAPDRTKAIQDRGCTVTKMPFGLKNTGATYQRLMDKAFESQMGRNIEIYVDDLVVKSHTEAKMVRDIEETFQTLRKINMKLNPKKCSFGLVEGVFLGYVITPEGIKPFSDKTTAVLQLSSPQTIKETLKKCIKKSDFRWTTEAEQAFQQLKQHLSALPLLAAPKPQEELIMYLSVTHGAISAILMTERGTVQTPVYFISRALQGPELNYSPMEKLVLSLVFASKRLRRYFQAHPITTFLTKCRAMPHKAYQSQRLKKNHGRCSRTAPSNNEAEYEALIAGLRIATQIGVKNIQANVDSKLVANQVLGMYVAKEDNMIKYMDIAKGLVSGFKTFSISQVPRSKNKKANAPSKIASTSFTYLSKQVLVEVLETKSITGKEVTTVIEEEGPTWMTELVNYLKEGTLPEDEKEARKLRLKARQYELMEGILYKRSFLTPWLRCVGPLQAEYVMKEIHEGSCSMHAGPRSVVAKAWIEAKAMATITDGQVKKFVWDNIVCRFGIPGEIISDNGKQFADNPFKDWCDKLNITHHFSSVKHPQSNGLVERANRSLGEGIKARLGEGNKNWVEELPHVLWAHRTMIKSSHGDTPFSLTYGTEAVIPVEIGMPTYRTTGVDAVNNDEELRLNLDLLEERRELAAMSEARSKSKMMKYYNSRVRGVAFKPGDFVYRSNDASHAVAGGKL
nr:hypothetical protein [Tanacetum cinerariifolium]